MFEKSEKFPEGWFFIKNNSNGYVLMVDNESQESGSPIVLATLRTKDYASQLWRHDPSGYLVNKKSGQVMDVAKGTPKAGVDIVQQAQASNVKEDLNFQKFGLSPYGHIYLANKPSLILGIKESFFARREGLHVHLQLVDKRHLDRKEQRWDFVLPIVKEASAEPLKRSASSSTVKSTTTSIKVPAVAQIKEDDARSVHSNAESTCSSIDNADANTVPTGSFPDTAFFLKSDASGLFISIESESSVTAGTQLTIDSLRKRNYDSQLWTYDASSYRIVNKFSGLVLGIERNAVKDGSDIVQTTSSSAENSSQAWILSPEGEVTLKNNDSFVIGFKESWFGSREGAHLHLQKRNKGHQHQKFTVVLPIFKKSSESTVKTEQRGVFPEGFFFVKSQAHGLVLTVLETGVIAAEVAATKLDTSNYSRQLWKYSEGYIINKASNMVLDVRGGSIENGANICQYTRKEKDNKNQQWALTPEGVIYLEVNRRFVLTVKESESVRSKLYLSERKAGHKEQCWNFVLPVFKKKQTAATAITKINTFRYATYPTSYFFIRSYVYGSTTESPLVLTAKDDKSVEISLLDRNHWQNQLWTYSSGKLINYATELSMDVSAASAGAEVTQVKGYVQKWSLTTDGYLFYGVFDDNKLALSVETQAENKYRLTLASHKYSQELRWGLLIPKFGYRSGVQVLSQWSISILREWRTITATTTTTKFVHQPVAEWPQGEFYISGPDGNALAPEKNESGSSLVMKQLEVATESIFKWTFRNGYLVHCVTGLVMRAQDFTEGSQLKLSSQAEGDLNQSWTLRTDGTIISKKDEKFGLHAVYVYGTWYTQVASHDYYSWKIMYGKYETRYSEQEKREISYLISFQRIVLSLWTIRRHDDVERKLVTHSYGVFPKGWVFIRSKCDDGLLITVSDKKKGAKLILAKLDIKTYRRQLWRYRDDGCLVNFDTDYVIDIAGGKLFSNANIIQWSPKFLRSSRKNQMWGLTVNGHIHPQSNSDLVLSSVGSHAKAGAELKLVKRGDLSLDYQQWSFATPVFGQCAHTTYAAQQAHKDSLVFEKIGSSCSISESSSERYERVTKKTIVRRWGVFPEGGFFIRCSHGAKNLALTVERDESTSQYRVVIRSLNFKAYRWQFWTYSNGYLINEETGFVLDAQASQDIAIEGEQTQVYLKEKASNEGQFWDLGVNGEIHLRSNERLTLGVAGSGEASVEGTQVGISRVRVVRTNVDGKQVSALKSDEWLRWTFSKPIFGKRTTTSTTTNTVTEGEASLEIEKCEEQALTVKEQDEVLNDEEAEEEEEQEQEEEAEAEAEAEEVKETDDSDYEIQTPVQTPSSSSTTSSSAAGVAIVTAGTVVAVAAGTTANVIAGSSTTEEKATIATVTAVDTTTSKSDIVATVETPAKVEHTEEVASPVLKKSDSAKSQRLTRKDSFQLEENYIPTGFEKIVRFKSHHGGYPSGYFFIKSSLHGYVLDVVGDIKEGSFAVLTRMKSTDFASQLWSYQNGFLVNLKGRVLVLDAANAALVAGERVHLSIRNSKAEGFEDQAWEYSAEGSIYLKSKRSFVLSLKETKRSDAYTQIDVYVHEAKALVKKQARPEQHWEILVPALIPVSQGESGVKIIESGKVEKVTSSASAIISYKWLKETYCHKVTSQNQWPGTEGWFFIRFGNENHFLAAGDSAQSQVGLYKISHDLDYRRFLWTFIDGYLINYRYMLRLVLSTSHRWILSNSHSTLNQKFYIHANGSISVRISRIIYYIRFIRTKSGAYTLDVTSDSASKDIQGLELHIPVIADSEYQKKSVLAISSANAWIRKQKSDWSILTSTTVRRGAFPASAWFFIKATHKGSDELVLSVQESSNQLVLNKLDFKSFKSQLWTYNDGLLINYGSKFVIDVQGSVSIKSCIIHAAEAGVSTQKWYLTSEGRIELDSHDFYILGCNDFKHGAQVLLGSSRTSSSVKTIQWKFSTPVFGKRSTTSTTTSTTITDITKEIENGAVIEGANEVVSNKTQQALTRRTTKHSYVIYRESRLIISWWRIIFIRRLSTCRTQKEYLEVIEQYRQILYSRFAQYLEVYGSSVTKEERIALEASIEETKSTLETEVFTKSTTYLKTLKSDEEVSSKQLDVSTIVSGCCYSIDKKYGIIISKAEKESSATSEPSKSSTTVSTDQQVVKYYESESEAVDGVLVIVDTIQITIRYWFRTLYGRISEATKNGAKKEEIDLLIKESHKDLQGQLTKISETTSSSLSGSVTLSEEYKKSFEKSVSSVIEKSNTEVERFVSNVDVSTVTTVDNWKKLTGAVDNTLSLKFHECKNTVQEVDIVSEIDTKKEESVQVSEEEVENSKLEIVTTLAESKAYVISWFTNIYKDISWSVESSSTTQEDTLTIVDAAELDIIAKIDESVALLSVLSSSLTYLSWAERRRLVTYYISMKTYLLANLKRFRASVAESDKETILKICQSTFSEDEQTDILKNIDYILENVSVTTTTTTATTASGAIISNEKEDMNVDIIVKDTQSIAVGVISDSKVVSQVEDITKESESISTGVIHGETDTSSKANVITSGSESVAVGIISGNIIDSKTTSSIETDVKESTSGSAAIVTEGESVSSEVTKDSESITVVSGEKESSSNTEKKDTKSTVGTGIATGIVVGVAAGIVAEIVSNEKESSSKVDIIVNESTSTTVGVVQDSKAVSNSGESVSVGVIDDSASSKTKYEQEAESTIIGVISGDKDTCTKSEGASVGIIVGSESKIDVITKESDSVSVIAEEKESTTVTDVIDSETTIIDVVSGTKETVSKSEDAAVGVIVGSDSKVDVITKESGSVSIISEEKESTTVTDVCDTEATVIDVVSGTKETVSKSEDAAIGIIVGSDSKVDVITKESGSVSIIADEKESTTVSDVIGSEATVIGVVSGTKETITKSEDAAVGIVVDSDSKIDLITKESSSVSIIADEKESTTVTDVVNTENTVIDVVSGTKETVSKSEEAAIGVIVGSESKVDVITKESGSISIIAEEKESTSVTDVIGSETTVIGVISGTNENVSKSEDSAVGIIVGSDSKIDVITKESGSVSIIAEENESTTVTDVIDSEKTVIDVVSGTKETVCKSEDSSVGIIVGSDSKVDVITKESGSVSIIAEEKESTSVADVISGTKETVSKSEEAAVGIIVGSDSKVDVITKESGSVSIIAGEKESTTVTNVIDSETTVIDVVSGTKETISKSEDSAVGIIVGSDSKVDVVTKESGSVSIIADEKESTTVSDVIGSEATVIGVISGTKETITKSEDAAVGIVVDSDSKIDLITKESSSVSIIADEKESTTVTDVVNTENTVIDVVSGTKETVSKSEDSSVGIIVGSESKVDVITKESGSISTIAEEKESTYVTDVIGSETTVIGVISGTNENVSKSEDSAVGIIVGSDSKIDVITKESGSVSIIAEENESTTVTDVIDSEKTVIDVVSGTKETVCKSEDAAVGIVVGSDSKVDVITKESGSVSIIAEEKESTTVTDVIDNETSVVDKISGTKKDTITKSEVAAIGVTAGVAIGAAIGIIVDSNKSKVDVITKESESVSIIAEENESSNVTDVINSKTTVIDVVSGTKETVSKSEDSAVGIIVGSDSKVDVITKESGSVSIIAEEKESTAAMDVVSGTKETITKSEDAAVGIIVGSDSKVDVITKESGSVSIVAEEKESTTVTDVVGTETTVIDVVSGTKETVSKSEEAAIGIIVGSDSKVDIITKESGSVSIIAEEKESTTVTDVIDVVSGTKETITKSEDAAIGIIVGSDSKVDVITKESGSVSIIAGEKESTTVTDVIDSETTVIDVVSGTKETISKSDDSALGIIVGSDSKVDIITKESGSVSIVAEEKESTTITDVINSEETVFKSEEAAIGIIVGSDSKVDVITKESSSVSIIADEKESTTVTDVFDTETSVIDVVSGTKETVSKSEEAAVGIIVGSKSKVDVITKESGSVSIIAEEKESTTVTDVIDSETTVIDVVSGSKETVSKSEDAAIGIIVGSDCKVDVITKESGSVSIVAEDNECTTVADVIESETTVIDVISGTKETVSKSEDSVIGVIVGSDSKVDVVTKESGSVSIIAEEKESTTVSDVTVSEAAVIDEVSGTKHTIIKSEGTANGVAAGVAVSSAIGIIVDSTKSKVNVITKESESVSIIAEQNEFTTVTDVVDSEKTVIDVVAGTKETVSKSEDTAIGIIVGSDSNVDIITKESGSVSIVAEEKESTTVIDAASGTKETITKSDDAAVGVVVGSDSKIDVITKESGSVSIIAEEKESTTVTDIVSGTKETVSKSEDAAVGIIVGSDSKVDVITKESGSVSIVAEEKESTTVTADVVGTETAVIDVVSGTEETVSKSEEAAIGIIVGSDSKVDIITKESGSVSIIAEEKESNTVSDIIDSETTVIDVISGSKETVSKSEDAAIGIIVGSDCKVDVITKESGSVSIVAEDNECTTVADVIESETTVIDVISGTKETVSKSEDSVIGVIVGSDSKVDVVTKESGSVSIIAEEKESTTITDAINSEETVFKSEEAAIGIIVGSDSKVDVITKESSSVSIIADEKESTTVTDVFDTETSVIDVVSGTKETVSKSEEAAVGIIVGSESKVDVITKESGSVSIIAEEKESTTVTDVVDSETTVIDVVSGTKETVSKSEDAAVGIIVGSESKVDIVTKESGSVSIITEEKESTTITDVINTETTVTDVVAGTKDTVSKSEEAVVGIIVGSESKVDVFTKESGSVSIITEEKESTSVTDIIDNKTSAIDQVSGIKDTITKSECAVIGVGAIGAIGAIVVSAKSKEDVVTKDSESVSIIAEEKESTSVTDVIESETTAIDVVSSTKDTVSKSDGSAVGIIVGGESQIDVVTKESGCASVIAEEKESTTIIDVISGTKEIFSKSEEAAVGIIVGSDSKVDVITKESGSVSVIAEEKESTTVTDVIDSETTVVDVVSGTKETVSKSEGAAVGIIVGSESKVDVVTKESGSVSIIAEEKESITETTVIDVVSGTEETVSKSEDAAIGIIVGSDSKVDVITKESGSVSIIAEEKESTTVTDVIDSETTVIDVVSGTKETVSKSEGAAVGIIVGSESKVDIVTKESGSVSIIAEEKESITETTVIDVVSGTEETVSKSEDAAIGIIVGSDSKVDVITKESGSVSVIAEEKESTTVTDVIDSEATVIDVVSGTKETVSKSEEAAVGIIVGSDSKVDIITKESGSVSIIAEEKESNIVSDIIDSETTVIDVVSGTKNTVSKSEDAATGIVVGSDSKVDIITKESGSIIVVSDEKETESLEVGGVTDDKKSISKTTVAAGVTAGIVAGVIAGSIAGSSTESASVVTEDSSSSIGNISIIKDNKVFEGKTSGSIIESSVSEGIVVGEVNAGVIAVEQGKRTSGVNTVMVSKDSHLYTTEICGNYEKVTDSVSGWFARFVEKITAMLEVGDCSEDVNNVIVQEKAKLQVIIEESQHELSTSCSTVVSSNPREWTSFYKNLQGSIDSQVSSIKSAVDECYVDGGDVKTHHIDIHSVKEEFKKTVSAELSVAKVEVYEASKANATKVEIGHISGGSEVAIDVSKSSQQVIKQDVIYESVEHAQKETKKALTFTVSETQKKIASWYDLFFGRIKSIKFTSAASYKKEIDIIVTGALEDAAVLIKESKSSVEFNYSVSESCLSEVTSTVENAQKQALESLDSIYVIITEQTAAIQEIASSTSIESIQEKIAIVEEQSRRKTQIALEVTAETAISAGFEGKTVTWVETAQIPASFKDVKVFAFDLVDTIVNYRATISKAWFKLVAQKKNSCTLSHIDIDALIVRWYHIYLEQRLKAKHSEIDIHVLIIALKLALTEFSIGSAFNESELKTLASAWLHLELFEDASASIRKIKQLDGVYAVAISHAFTIRTMMDLARSGCLCWHAQFTADMFAACTVNNGTSTEVTVVSNTAMLLGLEKASELAVISSNPEILEAAKAYGSKTVSLNRFSATNKEHRFDIEFDGLDIFAESFETFYETKVLSTTKVEVPVSRSWFQRVVSTVTDTAETVSHAIIG